MKYALLIDSENAQPRMDDIFQELSKYGDTPIRYLVGDFTKSQVSPWLEVCKKHAITCIQTMNFTNGKNSLDISLVIEGMKILYEKDFIDGIIIVASDSDYTPLAREWRNAGKDVIGIGRKNSTESYRSSCNSFIYTENIFGGKFENNSSLTPISSLAAVIDSVLNDNNGKALLSVVVSAVKKAYSDFDVRNYGYQKAIDFFKNEFTHVELYKEDNRTYSLQYATKESSPDKASKERKVLKENPKKEVNKKEAPKKSSPKKETTKKATKKEKPKRVRELLPDTKKEILNTFKALNKESVSINDLGQILTRKGIKCQSQGFKRLTDMLNEVEEFSIEDKMIRLKSNLADASAPHVIVDSYDDMDIDF